MKKGKSVTDSTTNLWRRAIHGNILSKIFRLVPRNRIVEGTFKTRKSNPTSVGKSSSSRTPKIKISDVVEYPPSSDDRIAPSRIQDLPMPEIFRNDDKFSWSNFLSSSK